LINVQKLNFNLSWVSNHLEVKEKKKCKRKLRSNLFTMHILTILIDPSFTLLKFDLFCNNHQTLGVSKCISFECIPFCNHHQTLRILECIPHVVITTKHLNVFHAFPSCNHPPNFEDLRVHSPCCNHYQTFECISCISIL
jgi:hypothetical protein